MRNSTRMLIAVVLGCSTPAAALAGPLEDAQAAYDRGDFAETIRILHGAAAQGDSDAQYLLGSMYCFGKGVTQDYAEGLRWLRLSAGHGNGEAEFALGTSYETGKGVAVDNAEALRWYRLAAGHGVKDAADAVARLTNGN